VDIDTTIWFHPLLHFMDTPPRFRSTPPPRFRSISGFLDPCPHCLDRLIATFHPVEIRDAGIVVARVPKHVTSPDQPAYVLAYCLGMHPDHLPDCRICRETLAGFRIVEQEQQCPGHSNRTIRQFGIGQDDGVQIK